MEFEGLTEYTAARRLCVADPSAKELAQSMNFLSVLESPEGEVVRHDARVKQINAIFCLYANKQGNPIL
jgi:hypothetical protein